MTRHSIRLQAEQRLNDMLQNQLEIARHQAEGWRNFLATATALLAAVLVLKGRENVAELTPGFRWSVVVLMALGLLALLVSAFTAASAAHGRPGDLLEYATPGELLAWERTETGNIAGRINRARWLVVVGVLATAAGVMLTWLAPAAEKDPAVVTVHTTRGKVCGEVVVMDAKGITIKTKAAGGKKSADPGKRGGESERRLTWGTEATSASPGDTC
ncbi:hypothetical protein HW445_03195 [Streptomyces sp. UH6]|nr:hypothetical protein [Streptomyces sp. UH6]